MVAKIAKTSAKPSAWIVTPNDKGRKPIKSGKVFLDDKEEFEIELFNPLTVSVLADIKLNGQSISKTGLVLKPGQRFYLDCFVDDKKKFTFSTYEIGVDLESIIATQNNGLLEVFFYKEDVITLDNWRSRFDRVIVEKWYPSNYPTYNPPWNNIYCGGSFGNDNLGNSINSIKGFPFGGTTVNNTVMYSSNLNVGGSISTNSIETGRVEKGPESNQKFDEIEMDFEKNYISSTIIQILPESVKPVETKEIKRVNTYKEMVDKLKSNDIIELIKKLADLHSAGILTDEEFSNKKSELLSKI
jgi:hypothetical protein